MAQHPWHANWRADLAANRALREAQGKPGQRLRPAPRRYSYAAPFAEYEVSQSNRLTPRDVLGADAFVRRR